MAAVPGSESSPIAPPGADTASALPATNPAAATPGATSQERPRRRFSLRLTSLWGDSPPVRASLFGEILDWLLVPLLLLWPISVALTYVAAKSQANAPFDRAMGNQAQLLADHVRIERGRTVLNLPPAARDLLRADEVDQVYYQVLGQQGEVVAGEQDLPPPDEENIPAAGRVQYSNQFYKGVEVRVAVLAVDTPDVPLAGKGNGTRPPIVQVAETLEKRSQLAGELVKGVILPQFVILPAAVLLVWFGLVRGLVPLSRLTERIRARQPADLSPIDPRAAPEEVAPLIRSINQLMQRLELSLAGQQRFIANAAHQLRTPLAGLKTQTELALRQAHPEGDSAELRNSLEQMALSTERAARMVNQLLALTRAEREGRGDAGAAFAPVDLAALVRERVREWVPAALAKRIDLGLEIGEGQLNIEGDALLLHELVGNLLDNAIRYTPVGGVITARARRGGSGGTRGNSGTSAVVEIEDSGIGIPEAERELVFERFYRVLGSDPEGRNLEGSGLGLSIVREIATRHRAQVGVQANPAGHGTLFSVSFSLINPPGVPPGAG